MALKVFKFANNRINGLFGRNVGVFDGNDLKIVKNENRSSIFAKRTKFKNQVVDVMFLKFKNVKVKIGRFKLFQDLVQIWGMVATKNTGRI